MPRPGAGVGREAAMDPGSGGGLRASIRQKSHLDHFKQRIAPLRASAPPPLGPQTTRPPCPAQGNDENKRIEMMMMIMMMMALFCLSKRTPLLTHFLAHSSNQRRDQQTYRGKQNNAQQSTSGSPMEVYGSSEHR